MKIIFNCYAGFKLKILIFTPLLWSSRPMWDGSVDSFSSSWLFTCSGLPSSCMVYSSPNGRGPERNGPMFVKLQMISLWLEVFETSPSLTSSEG